MTMIAFLRDDFMGGAKQVASAVERPRKGKTSAYNGVTFKKSRKSKCWHVFMWLDGKQRRIGPYQDEIEVARAYDAKAKERCFSPQY